MIAPGAIMPRMPFTPVEADLKFATISPRQRATDDRLSDIARALWFGRHRNLGRAVVSANIIRLHPRRDPDPTDISTISFRPLVERSNLARGQADAVSCKRAGCESDDG